MYLPIGELGEKRDGNALRPDMRAKKAPKPTMKGTTWDGSEPVFSSRARLSLYISYLRPRFRYEQLTRPQPMGLRIEVRESGRQRYRTCTQQQKRIHSQDYR
jgi:hypothetical protein